MIGILLLIFAIHYYFTSHRKWSILIFLAFCFKGFQLLPDAVIGFKNTDLAIMYCAVICPFTVLFERGSITQDRTLKIMLIFFSYFMIASSFFSRYHYDFTWYQIIQGGRRMYIFLCYFFLVKLKKDEILWILEKLYYITLITSVLYSIQVITGLPTLPIRDYHFDLLTGFGRYYNSPPLLYLFIFVSVFYPKFVNIKRPIISIIIFSVALICTQGRTQMVTVLMMVIVGFLMRGSLTKTLKYVAVGTLVVLPFTGLIIDRFTSGSSKQTNTFTEIEGILNGDFIDAATTGHFRGYGTMTYRMAWFYERHLYLKERPLGEKTFGLGLISDSQDELVQRMYSFKVGLVYDEKDNIGQLSTPDFSYGNLLTKFGYVGGVFLFLIWFRLLVIGWKYKKKDEWMFILFLLSGEYILVSFAGDVISNPAYLSIFFILTTLYFCKLQDKALNTIREVANSSQQNDNIIDNDLQTQEVNSEDHTH